MTDQLDGRDLDRACAEAMGKIGGRWSTDPSTQAEKLVWLRQHFVLVCFGFYRDGEVWAQGSIDDVDTVDMGSSGTTIDQALARLIVALAKAKKE